MGLDFFFGARDPSASWVRDPSLRLECDLSAPSLSDVRFGDPVEFLSRFGPPRNPRASRDGVYRFDSSGFEIDAERGTVNCFCFFWTTSDRTSDLPFRGSFLFAGRPVALGERTSLGEFTDKFGQPYWKDVDAEETLLFYEFLPVEWQVEFGADGMLRALTLVTPPMLGEPADRDAYGVTKAWPPR